VSRYAAFLRGVNVGGQGMVRMTDVKVAFEGVGLADVRTYINSGNVVFQSAEREPRKLERVAEQALRGICDFSPRVVVKSLAEMQRIVKAIPAGWTDEKEWRYYVIFLRHTVDSPGIVEELTPRTDVEELIYAPGAVLWAARWSGLRRSNVAKLGRRPLYQEVTVRNLNTTRKIFEMMRTGSGRASRAS